MKTYLDSAAAATAQTQRKHPCASAMVRKIAGIAISLLMLSIGALPLAHAEKPTFTVQFPLGTPIIVDTNAPYTIIPKKLGFWKEEGIDVNVVHVAGGVASVQQMAVGRGDVTNTGTLVYLQAILNAPDIGLKIVAARGTNNWNTFVLEGSAITSMNDLKGKTIGVQSFSSGAYMFGKAALAASGLNPDTDVKWLAVGVSSQAAQAIQSGTVDAYASFFGPIEVVASKLGKKFVALPTPNDNVKGTGSMAMREQFTKDHPDIAVKFLRGVFKGMLFAATNPSAALQIYWDAVPQQRPRNKSVEEALKETLPNVTQLYRNAIVPDADGFMYVVPVESIQNTIDYLHRYGMIAEALDAKKIVEMKFAKEANAFDKQAIINMAKNWKPDDLKKK